MPNHLTISAPAKVNLCLDVLRKHESGYHEIQTVMQAVPTLFDTLEFFETDQSTTLSTEYCGEFFDKPPSEPLPSNEENLIIKAVNLLKKEYSIDKNLQIKLTKRIPISAGLGGGASNAATTLKALNGLWDLNLPTATLETLSAKLGMDVPFFIKGKTALCTHLGEIVSPLPIPQNLKITILPKSQWPNPLHSTSKTQNAYASLDPNLYGKNTKKTELLIQGLKTSNLDQIKNNLHNDFESLYKLSKSLVSPYLSGSGPALFQLIN